MSKYTPLWEHLKSSGDRQMKLSFDQIGQILGFDIDHAFLTYKKEARDYGYEVGKISLKEKHVSFAKIDADE